MLARIEEIEESHNISEANYTLATYPPERASQDENIKTAYFTIPYFGKPSLKLQSCVKAEMKEHGLSVIASYNTTTIGSYFNLKTFCSKYFKSCVVYKFNCSQDPRTSYIGETTRQLFKRIQEHTSTDKASAIFEHLFNCNGCQNHPNIFELFNILLSCKPNNIYSCEAFLIKKFKPSLNIQLGPGKGTKTSLSLY